MIRTFREKPSVDEIVDVMEKDGAAVIYGMAEHGLLDLIEDDLPDRETACGWVMDAPPWRAEIQRP